MTFNQMLSEAGIDLSTVVVLRHRPTEPQLRKVLPWLAAERPAVFNAYQSSQNEKVEKAIQKAKFVASFIGRKAGQATFAGLYSVAGWKQTPITVYASYPEVIELYKLGMGGNSQKSQRPEISWFDLQRTEHWADWRGKLIVKWPGPELSWMRWAAKNTFHIHAIAEESTFESNMPKWDDLVLQWDELRILPERWKAKLAEWRGIYYIFDRSNNQGYVGSASGDDNILGRWLGYAASGHGGNELLKSRDPRNFLFSILQRLSPDALTEDVIHCEVTWKKRLHSRFPTGLNDN